MTALRYPRDHRLLRKSDFHRVFREGRRVSSGGLSLVVCPGGATVSRLGMAVSRRFGNAVRRNRARRLIREAFRLQHQEFARVVDVIARPQDQRFPDNLQQVRTALKSAIEKAGRPKRSAPPRSSKGSSR